MKLYLKIICLLSALAMMSTLVSCTDDKGTDTSSVTDAVTEAKSYPSPDYTSHPDVMSIDGQNVTYEEYRYYFLNIKEKYDRADSTFWEGNSFDKEIKAEAEEYLFRQYAIEALAKQYNVSLSEEDIKTLDATIETNKADFNTIDEYNEYLDYLHLTDRSNYRLAMLYVLENKLFSYLTGDDSDNIIYADKELVNKFIENYVMCADWIVLYNDYGDDKNENKTLIERIYKQLEEGKSFTDLKIAHSEDKNTNASNDPQYFIEGTHDAYIDEAVKKLENGKYSEIIELPYGYAIVKKLEKDTKFIETNFNAHFAPLYEKSMFEIMLDKIIEKQQITYFDSYEGLTVKTVE